MKIIVPMAGIGSRLRPHTLTIPKPLTLIAGKPIVQRLVEDIVKVVDQKVDEIAFVIGPSFPKDTREKLMKIAKNLNAVGKVFVQEQALGTAHAIQCAKESLSGPCVVAFADTLFKADFTLDADMDGAIWVKQVDEPSAYGVVKVDNGIITDFVEKPQEFISDLAIIGIYYFKSGEILRNEIQYFGNKDITIETNSKVLQFAKIDGQNLVSKNVSLEDSKIIDPCYIGENVVLKNTTIGPNVSLGDNCVVENSTIKNSLIQTNTKIINANLNNAMIGNHAYFNGDFTSVSIGDFSILN